MNEIKPNLQGATVYAAISRVYVGTALHRLEHRPDIQLIERRNHHYSPTEELWTLRSLEFPRAWEGALVNLRVLSDRPGLEVVPV